METGGKIGGEPVIHILLEEDTYGADIDWSKY